MRASRSSGLSALSAALFILAFPPASAAERCETMNLTVTASFPNDPGFEGLYRYALGGNWEVWPRALSHFDVFLMFNDCPDICGPGVVVFGDTAGISTGSTVDEAPCYPVFYLGEYLCEGDPSLPEEFQASTVKFEPWEGQSCEPGTVGVGSWRFYSPLPPGPGTTHVDAALIKHGQYVCTGDVTGQLPGCSVETSRESWGMIKARYGESR